MLGGDGSILHALRRYAHTEVPVFGVNFGTVGFLAAVERDQAAEGIRRALEGEIETIQLPGLEVKVDGKEQVGAQRHHPRAPPPRPGRRAQLPDRRRGGGPRPLRRPGRRHPRRLDRLQPRQPGSDPGLGGEGLRRQLHLAALADRAGPGRRPGRRPPRRQRARARAGRGRGRRRQGRRPRSPATRSRSASSTRSAAWRSCRGRASTAASARSSATWPSSARALSRRRRFFRVSRHGTQVVDPGPGLDRDVHAAARRHRRQRRPAGHPAGTERQPLQPAVGRRRLLADARRLPADGRLARRPARPAARVHDRVRHLHPRLVPLRNRRGPDPAQPGARPAGDRRRRHVRHLAGADRPGVPRQRPGDGVRRLGGDGRRRGRGRAAGRRRRSPRTSAGSGSSSSTSRSGSRRWS